MTPIPQEPKLYHILHMDRLPSVLEEGGLVSDAEAQKRCLQGTTIGMGRIKRRRREACRLRSAPQLHVGDCVPFYFCSRSVMLFIFWKNDHPDLTYHGGQEDIVHLVFDMGRVLQWAESEGMHWAFTDSNASSGWFTDYHDLADLDKLRWDVIASNQWAGVTDGHETQAFKQAEFLVERFVPFRLVEQIGVIDEAHALAVQKLLAGHSAMDLPQVRREWYY